MIHGLKRKKRASRYAIAYFNTIGKSSQGEQLEQQMIDLAEWLKEHLLFYRLLQIGNVSSPSKDKMVDRLGSQLSLPEPLVKLLHVLLKNKAIDLLPEVITALRAENKKRGSIHDVLITTSHPLTDQQKADISKQITPLLPGNPVFTFICDSRLIGGIRIESATHYWEESIAQRLRALAQKREQPEII